MPFRGSGLGAGAPSSHFYWLVLPLNDPYSPGGVDGDSASFSLLLPGNRPGVATELDTLLFWEQQVAGSNPAAPIASLRADTRSTRCLKNRA
jgi:hypothetical protein